MRFLIASFVCTLLLTSAGCARRQSMKRECAALRQQRMAEQQRMHQQGMTPQDMMMRQRMMEQQQAASDAQRRARAGEGAAPEETPGEVADGIDVKETEHYGSYLVDDRGRALYLFTPDKGAQESTCYQSCAETWPPALAEGRTPRAQHPSVRDDRLGTIRRDDGSLQLTYNGWPLYYYSRDRAPGQATGQDLHEYGGEWYLLAPEGERVDAEKR